MPTGSPGSSPNCSTSAVWSPAGWSCAGSWSTCPELAASVVDEGSARISRALDGRRATFPGEFPEGVRRSGQDRAGPDQPGRERVQVRLAARAPHRGRLSATTSVSVAVTRPGRGHPASRPAEGVHQVLPPGRRAARPGPASGCGSAGAWSNPTAGSWSPNQIAGRVATFRFTLPLSIDLDETAGTVNAPTASPPMNDQSRSPPPSRPSRPRPGPASRPPATWPRLPRGRARRAGQTLELARLHTLLGRLAPERAHERSGRWINAARGRLQERADALDAALGARGPAGPGRGRTARPDRVHEPAPAGAAGRARPRSRPPQPGHPDPDRARGHLRRHGLRSGRGPRGRDRLVQLRGAQHAARPTRPGACGTPCTCGWARPRRCCCEPTPHRCRSG